MAADPSPSPSSASRRWIGPDGATCAVLVHSTDRAEARPFWRATLLGIDLHLPPLCQTYLSYGVADGKAREAVRGLRHPINLIRRGEPPARGGWAGDMLADLNQLHAHAWVLNMMDDGCIRDPIRRSSLKSVLDLAAARNASTVSLYARSLGFWNGSSGALVGPVHVVHLDASDAHEHMLQGGRSHPMLQFYSATSRSRLVIQQNFALWRRDSLIASLQRVDASATPWAWEGQLDRLSPSQRLKVWPDIARALWVQYARGADGLTGVEEIASGGRVKDGWSRCSWVRLSLRLGLPLDAVPGGSDIPYGNTLPGATYDFCTLAGAIGGGLHALSATPECGCRMHKAREGSRTVVKGVYCKCDHQA